MVADEGGQSLPLAGRYVRNALTAQQFCAMLLDNKTNLLCNNILGNPSHHPVILQHSCNLYNSDLLTRQINKLLNKCPSDQRVTVMNVLNVHPTESFAVNHT